jgi:Predicted membrane protein
MAFSELLYMQEMTPDQRMLFQSQYARSQKNRTAAFLFTFFLGGFGAHRFYLGQIGLGVLYAVFFWTFIPAIISFFELFLILGRVDRYNENLAQELARGVKMLGPAPQTA